MSDLWVSAADKYRSPKDVPGGWRTIGMAIRATRADLLSAVRSLEGVEEVRPRDAALFFDDFTGSYKTLKPGRWLVVPLGLEEEG